MGAPKGNKNAIGNNGGSPPYFTDPNEMQKKVDDYFEFGANKKSFYTKDGEEYKVTVYTVTGLALYLGFSTRQSLLDYAEKVEFVDIIKKAKTRIEMAYEEGLQFPNCTGNIFALKNMGWADKQEFDHTSDGNPISINIIPASKRDGM